MNLDGGQPDIRSFMGAFCSILLFAIVLVYAYQKTEILINKKNVDIFTTTNENALTSDDKFAYANGFNVAAAFVLYDDNTEWSLDPSYGELVFKHYGWGQYEDGSYYYHR